MNDRRDNGQNKDTNLRWRHPNSISAAQFEAVKKAAEELDGVEFEWEPAEAPPLTIWQKDHILVRSDVDETSNDKLLDLGAVPAPTQRNGRTLLPRAELGRLLVLENRKNVAPRTSTREIVEDLNRERGLEGKVNLNNLVYVTHQDGANLCPANEPMPTRPYPQTVPYPPASPGNTGAGVRITVIDTGLSPGWEGKYPWLDPDEVKGDEELQTVVAGEITSHAGHGLFIAGLIRCVAPRAMVTVLPTLRWAGAMDEYEVAHTILDVLDNDPPDILSLSAGYMIHDGQGAGPQAMLTVMQRLKDPTCPTVLVAATGNDGHGPDDHGLFYPAAFAAPNPFDDYDYVGNGRLVAVGALRQDRLGRACFSNYGEWVTVYEDGENLVNAFPVGKYTYREPVHVPPKCTYYPNAHHDQPLTDACCCLSAPTEGSVASFTGMASWSGTSFATPIVAARIARHLTEDPNLATSQEATQDLLNQRITISDAGDGIKLPMFAQPAVY